MSSINGAGNIDRGSKASRVPLDAPVLSSAGFWSFLRLSAVVFTAAALAACAQSSALTSKSELRAASRQASLENNQTAPELTDRRVVSKTKKHTPFGGEKPAATTKVTSHGIASYYTEGEQTASGEKFDPRELTAAHPTLPFGTRLRVTNVASGRSVTVRINDRGPFVPGRIVDVSYAAAETLGIVGRGVANVRLDVVH